MKVIKHKDKWYLQSETGYKEILLSTNKLLIKDGVQPIDDDFLEWFVKNPSYEKVGVTFGCLEERQCGCDSNARCLKPGYKIIIPKEEPKQTVQEYEQQGLEKHSYELEPKQELLEEAAEIEKIAMDKLKSKWEHLYTFGYPLMLKKTISYKL
jgi:hypothetical protein